ncbi:MAG TPA: carboxypeptidase-like regulatory domain-containing protein [Candidatus Solibacter sp.]|nr:carboxypeptidase-like regulatory domain-containing protein [Candidatus Solibacter sp.]
MTRNRSTLLPVLLVCILFSAVAAHAQYRGSIQGVVADQQGAVVPQANVTLRNLETGVTQVAVTDDRGIFNFNGLPPAEFSITVEKSGFKKKVIERFGITAEQANAMNIQLDVGQASESVSVNGDAAPLLDTESADVSGTIKSSQFQALPSFGRDPFQLLQLAPGAFGDGSQSSGGGTNNLPSTTIGGTGGSDGVFKTENGGQISANGARTGENNYQIDGVGTTSVSWGGTSVITPNEDSIKEIKVVTDNYDAENGRYRGAQVQVITQNGTNTPHGSVYFKVHRPGLNAYTKYNGYGQGNTRDDNRFNDWGGSVGAPIVKNKLFGFFSYETILNNAQQHTGGSWYETDAFRSLAASGTNAAQILGYPGVAPNGGKQVDAIGNNILNCQSIGLTENVNCITIPGQGLNLGTPLTTGLYTQDHNGGAFDPGTGGDGLGGANNLDPTTADIAFIEGTIEPTKNSFRQYNGRVDFTATSKDLIAASFYWVPTPTTGLNGDGDRQMNVFHSGYKNKAATLLWDHTFGASMANEARVNAAGWSQKDLGQNPNAPFGLPVIGYNAIGDVSTGGSGGTQLNGIGVGSFNGFDQWTYAAKDVLTKIHGAHTMKMGGEFTRTLFVDAPYWADRPSYNFNNMWDFLNDAPNSENAQFDPNTGIPSALRKDLRQNIVGLFFQDNWKAKSNLTLTLGVRWELFSGTSEKHGKLGNVVLGSGANEFTGLRMSLGGSMFTPQKSNFGPQLGFAWNPKQFLGHDYSNRLVIRGGFGIAYNSISTSNTGDTRFNPPFVDNGANLSGCQIIPGDSSTDSCPILYAAGWGANLKSPNNFASNPSGFVQFDPSTHLPLSGTVDLTAFPTNLPTTQSLHYTLGAEYDLGHNWVASAGYQGSHTYNLLEHYNLYNPGSAAGIALNPVVHGITIYADDSTATFNALLLELKHNFGNSFQLDTQYRWAHSQDFGSNAYGAPYWQWGGLNVLATSDYDVKHAFKMYGVWSPTLFHGQNSWMEKVAGGWSLSGILNAHTGFPFTPFYGNSEITGGYDPVFSFGQNSGGSSSDAGSGVLLPSAQSGLFKPNGRASGHVDGAAYFTPPTVVPGTLFTCLFQNTDPACGPGPVNAPQPFGPLPTAPGIQRNSYRGSGYFDLDATLSKSFGLPPMKVIGENGRIEFRINFYNLFNKLNLWNPQPDILSGHLGEAQSALGSRVIEMQARFNF